VARAPTSWPGRAAAWWRDQQNPDDVPSGVTLNDADVGWQPPALTDPHLRRGPASDRSVGLIPPAGELPAHRRDLPPGQQPQGRVLPRAAAGVPGPGAALLAGETAVGRVLLRRVRGRRAYLCLAPVHRTAEATRLTGSRPPASTTGLKPSALADKLVAAEGAGAEKRCTRPGPVRHSWARSCA